MVRYAVIRHIKRILLVDAIVGSCFSRDAAGKDLLQQRTIFFGSKRPALNLVAQDNKLN